jgi:hypothetical protein
MAVAVAEWQWTVAVLHVPVLSMVWQWQRWRFSQWLAAVAEVMEMAETAMVARVAVAVGSGSMSVIGVAEWQLWQCYRWCGCVYKKKKKKKKKLTDPPPPPPLSQPAWQPRARAVGRTAWSAGEGRKMRREQAVL